MRDFSFFFTTTLVNNGMKSFFNLSSLPAWDGPQHVFPSTFPLNLRGRQSLHFVLNVSGFQSVLVNRMSRSSWNAKASRCVEWAFHVLSDTLSFCKFFPSFLSFPPQDVTKHDTIQAKNAIRESVPVRLSADNHSERANAKIHHAGRHVWHLSGILKRKEPRGQAK